MIILLPNSFQTPDDIQKYLSDPQRLYTIVSENLDNRDIKTYKYADVPFRNAAVILPIFFKDQEAHLLFTKRTDKVEHHKGQISLPGGVQEKNESLPDAARRETWEEIGIDAEKIKIITALTSLYVPITGFKIHPFVGWINSGHAINTEPREVKKLYSIGIQNLLDNNSLANETRIIRGYEVMVPFFRFNECEVWGATAMILAEFRQLLLNLESELT